MYIETEVTITDTVKIHINADEAIAAILEFEPPVSKRKILSLLNGVAVSLREIPDEVVAEMTDAQRKLVSELFLEQSLRYAK
jgi:hypothetical protein